MVPVTRVQLARPILILLLLLTFGQHALASQSDARPLVADSALRSGTLPNGLRYVLRHHDYPAKRAEARLVINAGSVYEDDDQLGVAHLLEHLAFSGTPQFPGDAVWPFFERIGMSVGADINATTGFDETIYQLTLPTDSITQFAAGIRLLAEWSDAMTLDSLQLPRERKVVLEEWRGSLGPGQRLTERSFAALLAGTPYPKRFPIGDPELLRTVGIEPVKRFYRDWYRPERMSVVIVGDIDVAKVEQDLKQRFTTAAHGAARPEPSLGTPGAIAPAVIVVADSQFSVTTTALTYRYPRESMRTEADVRRSMARSLFDDLLNERFRTAALDANPPFLGASASASSLTRSTFGYQVRVTTRGGQLLAGLEAARAELARVQAAGFTEAELQRSRLRIGRQLDQLADGRDRVESRDLADEIAAAQLSGDVVLSIDSRLALGRSTLTAVTLDEVVRAGLARLVDSAPVAIAALPLGDTLSETALLAALRQRPAELRAYAEGTGAVNLLDSLPRAGRLRRMNREEAVGVTRIELANGVRVLLKPTTFDKSQVLLTAYRNGGLSRAPDSLLVPALTAPGAVCGAGIGRYDPVALTRMLAGKVVGLSCSLDTFEEGFSGGAAPADLETLFQVIYLQFTAPRIDAAVSARMKASLAERVAHRGTDPASAVNDTLALLLSGRSPRTRLLDSTFIDQLDAARSLAFVQQRFANAAGFTFVFAGSFQVDSIVPLIERYLGSLRGSAQGQQPVPSASLTPVAGGAERVLPLSREPRASVTQVFYRAGVSSRTEYIRVAAVTHVLRSRLQARVRRELGGVYGVDVGAEAVATPANSYRISVSFDCDPERRAELEATIRHEITDLAAHGATPAELVAFHAERRRTRESAMQTNSWWLSNLARADKMGWPLPSILSDREAEQVSASDVALAADRYLKRADRIAVTLVPAGG